MNYYALALKFRTSLSLYFNLLVGFNHKLFIPNLDLIFSGLSYRAI